MKRAQPLISRCSLVFLLNLVTVAPHSFSQTSAYERTFPEPPARVERALKSLLPLSGRLPTLEGFAASGTRPLERYQRAFYQCTIQVTSAPDGGSRVQIGAKITAWYADSDSSKSGYQLLPSNGRIESDLLDRLGDALGKKAEVPEMPRPAQTPPAGTQAPNDESPPLVSAPTGGTFAPGGSITETMRAGASRLNSNAAADSGQTPKPGPPQPDDPHIDELTKQAKNLQEILRNQARPTNLVAVRHDNTPVLASPSESAKELFQASAEDEFEVLDANSNWVHVRISGLSRGWIRRSELEMPGSSQPAAQKPQEPPASAPAPDASLFQVESEQIASFPGDWEPLRGKTVKIVSVQNAPGKSVDIDSYAKLEFAKSVFKKEYAELAETSSSAAGVVLIFDSVDGGMLAATVPVLQLWKSGTLSDEAMWRRCYVDPPEMFSSGQ